MRSHPIIFEHFVTTWEGPRTASSFDPLFLMSSSRARLESLSGVLEGRLDELVKNSLRSLASLSGVLSYCERFEAGGEVKLPLRLSFTLAALSNVPVKRDRLMNSESEPVLEVERRACVRAKDVGASGGKPSKRSEQNFSERIGRPNCWQHIQPYSKPEESELAISNASNSSAYQEMSP